jgi:hypothetical protein
LDALDRPDNLRSGLARGRIKRVAHDNVLHANRARHLLTGGGEVECSLACRVGWNTLAEWNGLLGVVAPCCEQIIVKAKLLGLRDTPRGKVLTSDAVMVFCCRSRTRTSIPCRANAAETELPPTPPPTTTTSACVRMCFPQYF